MALTILGNEQHSISVSGPMLLQQGSFSGIFSNIIIDLASAPLPPGQYSIQLLCIFSNIEIYLPRYVQFTLDGAMLLGNKDMREGPQAWEKLLKNFRGKLNLPLYPPEPALTAYNYEEPTYVYFNVSGAFGNVNIYRL